MPENRTVFISFGTKPIAEMTLTEIIDELNSSRQGLFMLKREVETLRALLVDEIIQVTYKKSESEVDKEPTPVVDSEQSDEGNEKKGNFQA